MTTQCNPEQLEFHALGRREVIGRFDGGRITSDGGGLLLREVDQCLGLLNRLAACFTDYRNLPYHYTFPLSYRRRRRPTRHYLFPSPIRYRRNYPSSQGLSYLVHRLCTLPSHPQEV